MPFQTSLNRYNKLAEVQDKKRRWWWWSDRYKMMNILRSYCPLNTAASSSSVFYDSQILFLSSQFFYVRHGCLLLILIPIFCAVHSTSHWSLLTACLESKKKNFPSVCHTRNNNQLPSPLNSQEKIAAWYQFKGIFL